MVEEYRVRTGKHETKIKANCHEDATVFALQKILLEGAGMFIAVKREQDKEEDEQWGLTEWYLERAGYTNIGNGRWKKNASHVVRSGLPSESGSNQKKESVAQTSKRLEEKPQSILKIDLAEPSQKAIDVEEKVFDQTNEHSSVSSETMETKSGNSNKPRKVTLKRTPEQWQAIIEAARAKK